MQAYFTLFIGLALGALLGYLLGQRKKPAIDISQELNKRDTSLEMKTSLEELSKKVSALSAQTAEADKARATADAALKQELTNMASINTNLLNQSTKLAGALASSQTRGKYGEAQLESLLESAGLIQGVHYEVQRGTTTSEGVAGIPDV
ncbi:MAG: DNA recombination protein RmuC, partial [Candidatus Nanopelagicaceae bacterium]